MSSTWIFIPIIFALSLLLLLTVALLLLNTTNTFGSSGELLKHQSYERFVAKHGIKDMSYGQYWNCGSLGGASLGSVGNGSSWQYTEEVCGDDGVTRPMPSKTAQGKYIDVIDKGNTVTIQYLKQPRDTWYAQRLNQTISEYESKGYEVLGEPVRLKSFGQSCYMRDDFCMGWLYQMTMVKPENPI